jgi:hypothetical protein
MLPSRKSIRSVLTFMLPTCTAFVCDCGHAQPTVSADQVRRCATITRGVERLDCFDELARSLDADAPAPEPAPGDASDASADVDGVDAFGAELIEDTETEVPREVKSRLVGEFTGWRGNTVFQLENGQIWRQAQAGRLIFNADAPMVTIRRGAFNSYRLSVEGVNSTVRVKRIE